MEEVKSISDHPQADEMQQLASVLIDMIVGTVEANLAIRQINFCPGCFCRILGQSLAATAAIHDRRKFDNDQDFFNFMLNDYRYALETQYAQTVHDETSATRATHEGPSQPQ
jgi:predicted component of type VI protein secretion system